MFCVLLHSSDLVYFFFTNNITEIESENRGSDAPQLPLILLKVGGLYMLTWKWCPFSHTHARTHKHSLVNILPVASLETRTMKQPSGGVGR